MELHIGHNIKRLRRARGLTQRQMAEHLRISTQAVSKWERGLTYPDVTLLLPIAELFCVTLDELFGRHAAEE
ncbi:MAG: helix-turn-helix transcriptional regulator [Clostridia bacterium]|nr:helix-turn-helix transcriptional regulator [Clostridia bacterium]